MTDTYWRGAGEQAGHGYRQLPSVGSEGPDLKTLVCAGLGVALGIVVGTALAGGSWRTPSPIAQHHSVQTSSGAPGSVDHLAAKAAAAPTLQAQTTAHPTPQPSPAQQSPVLQPSAAHEAPAVRKATAPAPASATHEVAGTREVLVARQVSSAHEAPGTLEASGTQKAYSARSVTSAHRLPAAHRRRSVHGSAAWRRHLARRAALRRRRLRTPSSAAIANALPFPDTALKPDDPPTPFAFMVEGELTVSSFDASTGTIDTYEGETFALDQGLSAGNGIHVGDLSSNIHYRCNPFGRCTLLAGQFVLDAMRTR